MTTKHEQILTYIEALEVGSKISVRQIAKAMEVSEGTAYRAIKDAEARGIVSTIERVGTVRIEKQQKKNIERLTFAEVVNIVEGTVLGGRAGLHKTLSKFVIGAMKIDAMLKYVDVDSLLIVGNRETVHKASLEHGAAVLITGGFDTSDEVKELADALALPLISSAYDTFTIATLINRAIDDRLIKKEILLVEDLVNRDKAEPVSLHLGDTVGDWHRMVEQTGHTRFPVIDRDGKVHGIITSKDVAAVAGDQLLERVMTKSPRTVTGRTSVASAAHTMIWEGIELLPVVEHRKLVGVISRQDVLRALQYNQNQPQGQTIQDLILSGFEEAREERSVRLSGVVTPIMTNQLGSINPGVLMTLINEAGESAIRRLKNSDMVVENVTVYFLKPIQIESQVSVVATVIDIGRKFGKVDVEIYSGHDLMGKALLTAQVLER
ncbi:DRTGG domain-containing protein [Tumebacillus permanentifrigoris]|uniref:Putative transcriptional regulator n=1 Tax=Tumebacillus permanentifrigoris TaxID=378543 RepID=A0A316DCA5_9BACL|nr:DRTGG domain-containing protein [Tumebacillus permanentifrigoris]PWK13863.1 putative transcriptional regulator [Tumebacillus permanentifrigoris]